MSGRILVAGIGNVFFGDDAFGVEVVSRLRGRDLGDDVVLRDLGIRGLDLAYALLDDFDAAILIDAMARGNPPGTLVVIEPEAAELSEEELLVGGPMVLDPHGMDPARVLAYLRAVGAPLRRLRVIGCEPESFGSEDEPAVGLSEAVSASLDIAVEVVERVLAELRTTAPGAASIAQETADA